MSKVLIISYAWPPRGGVGMIRVARFAKYLVRLGHEITVLTEGSAPGNIHWDIEEPELKKVKVIKITARRENSPLRYIKQRFSLGLELDWFYSVKRKLKNILKDIECDIIVSSSPPESAHLIALEVKKELHKPWIADLRDLWALDHYRAFDFLRRGILGLEEKNILSKADRIVTVSYGWGEVLKKRYGGRVRVIANGFDEEWFGAGERSRQSKFRISYLGKLNADHQDVRPFLRAVRDIIDKKEVTPGAFEANFYISGYGKPDIKKMAASLGLGAVVKEHASVPLSRAIDIMRNSGLLLLAGWKGLSGQCWRPQKIYEYLGSGTPVLLVNSSEKTELAKVIFDTESGSVANNTPMIKDAILRSYKDFKENNLRSPGTGKNALNDYTARSAANKLCRLMEEVRS